MIVLTVLVWPGDNCPLPARGAGPRASSMQKYKMTPNIASPKMSKLDHRTSHLTKFGRLDPPWLEFLEPKTSNFGEQNSIKNLPAWEFLSRPRSPLYRRLIVHCWTRDRDWKLRWPHGLVPEHNIVFFRVTQSYTYLHTWRYAVTILQSCSRTSTDVRPHARVL